MSLPIIVRPGSIEVEAVSGLIKDDYFFLYVSLKEKYVEAEVVMENPALVILRAGEKTIPSEGVALADLQAKNSTEIELPSGWSVGVDVARYTCQIIGIRTPPSEDLTRDLPFVVEGVQVKPPTA